MDILRYERTFELDDIIVRSGGSGREVEAYAAIFGTWAEIRDQHGHYLESISRSAFDRVLADGFAHVGVFYNHGMTIHGQQSSLGSVPIGSPVDIRTDGRGLWTVSRFNRSQLADMVLEAIRNGDIKGYSFRGPVHASDPPHRRIQRTSGPLTRVTRTVLGLTEYGPTPSPAYVGAGILAVA